MRLALSALSVLIALALPAIAAPTCTPVSGEFIAIAEPACAESPVLFCTRGTLTGDLDGAYDFTMTSQTAGSDPARPQRLTFTGESIITLDDGRMFALDTGRMDADASGRFPFETIVNIHSGDGHHTGATGRLVATGALDLARGVTEGTYAGHLCGA